MSNNLYMANGKPAAGGFGRSGDPRLELAAVQEGFEKLKRHHVRFHFPDLNTAADKYLEAGEVGSITRISVIPDADNATTATVITAAIGATPITMPTLQLALGALKGVAAAVAPSADNSITSRTQVIKVTTDGGGSSAMPGTVVVEIERS